MTMFDDFDDFDDPKPDEFDGPVEGHEPDIRDDPKHQARVRLHYVRMAAAKDQAQGADLADLEEIVERGDELELGVLEVFGAKNEIARRKAKKAKP